MNFNRCSNCGNLFATENCPLCSPETILGQLRGNNIFCIEKLENGNYKFEECCDNYYDCELSKDDVEKLIAELQELIK